MEGTINRIPSNKFPGLPFAERAVNRSLRFYRILTSPIRVLPDFLIIGAQKCGTTSLFNYLSKHPCVSPSTKKEIGFFTGNFWKGVAWYRSFFPTSYRLHRQNLITGEASTGYIYHPHAPKRIAERIPQVKLIALLRNPIDRAYSHYCHTVRLGMESLSFEEAIEKEDERLHSVAERILKYRNYYHPDYHYYSYLSRGIYVDQLKVWLKLFSKEQILILSSEGLYAEPSAALEQVLKFLDIPKWEPKKYKQYNYNRYQEMIDPTTRKYLVDYFKPHNERLYKLLRCNFDWDK